MCGLCWGRTYPVVLLVVLNLEVVDTLEVLQSSPTHPNPVRHHLALAVHNGHHSGPGENVMQWVHKNWSKMVTTAGLVVPMKTVCKLPLKLPVKKPERVLEGASSLRLTRENEKKYAGGDNQSSDVDESQSLSMLQRRSQSGQSHQQ